VRIRRNLPAMEILSDAFDSVLDLGGDNQKVVTRKYTNFIKTGLEMQAAHKHIRISNRAIPKINRASKLALKDMPQAHGLVGASVNTVAANNSISKRKPSSYSTLAIDDWLLELDSMLKSIKLQLDKNV